MRHTITLLLLSISMVVSATKYYVSTSGNNANDGLTTATPWQTIQYAEANATNPGDIIALKKGDIWLTNIALGIHHGGVSGNPITWDGALWGSGANAIIRSSADRRSPNMSVVNIIGCNYVTFQNITVDGNNTYTFGLVVGGTDNYYSAGGVQDSEKGITIQNSAVLNSGNGSNYAIGFLAQTWNNGMSDITIKGNTFDGAGDELLSFYNGKSIDGGTPAETNNVYIGYNTLTNWGRRGQSTGYGLQINNKITDVTIEHNTLSTGPDGYGNALHIESNEPISGWFPDRIKIRYNKIHTTSDNKYGIYITQGQAKTVFVYSNLIYSETKTSSGGGIWIVTSSSPSWSGAELKLYNNTIYTLAGRSFMNDCSVPGVVTFKNNLIYNAGNDNYGNICLINNIAGISSHSNNLYYRSENINYTKVKAGGSYLQTPSQVLSWEADAIVAAPLFKNPGTDFRLQEGSPAIGAGTPIAGITKDIEGVTLSNPPDIGCYQSSSGQTSNAPVVATGIGDVALNEGFGIHEINLTGAFSDPDSDPLTYTAVSANNTVVTVNVTGNTLTVTEVKHGITSVTVTASDGSTNVNTSFNVDVNGAPDVTGPLVNIALENGFGSTTVNIAGVFTDPEGDALTYAISNSDETAATAALNGIEITITEEAYGTATLTITANDGQLTTTEKFIVTVNVVLPPDWSFEPADYDYNGQLTAQVYIDRDTVRSGFLGAFVNGECRGIVDPIYFAMEDYFVYNMIVYSDVSSGAHLKFKYYDYDSGMEYELYDSVAFTADMILANAFNPVRLHYYLGFEKSLVTGWNWFSMNRDVLDRSLGAVMPECVVGGDYIKNQTVSATYLEGYGWFGDLKEIDPTMLYKTRINGACGINTPGNSVPMQNTPIQLVRGWNWVGYLPDAPLSIDEALASYTVTDLDYIKSQLASATYYEGFGWYGSMKSINPGEGFMIKVAEPSTLVYPEPSTRKSMFVEGNDPLPAGVDPTQYEFSGTVTARVYLDGEAIGSEDDLLMAYVGDECRGVIQGSYFNPAGAYAYQILIYSNLANGEQVTFRYYQSDTDRTYDCAETLEFSSDMIVADARQAFVLNLDNTVGIDGSPVEQGISMNVYPNPFRNNLQIDFTVQEETHMQLSVYDMTGKMIMVLEEEQLAPGTFSIEWKAGDLPRGTYILKAVMETEQIVKRVTLID